MVLSYQEYTRRQRCRTDDDKDTFDENIKVWCHKCHTYHAYGDLHRFKKGNTLMCNCPEVKHIRLMIVELDEIKLLNNRCDVVDYFY